MWPIGTAQQQANSSEVRPIAFVNKIALSALLQLLLSAVSTSAQTPAPPIFKWDFSIWIAGETGEELTNSFTESQIWSAGLFVGRTLTDYRGPGWLRGNLEYAFDAMPIFEAYGPQRTHGYGFDPVILRWNSALHRNRLAPYVELSGGGVATPVNFPPGDTSTFNFMAKGGSGIYLQTRSREALDIGLRWSHISNANLGVDNQEFNGIQLTVAYHWFR